MHCPLPVVFHHSADMCQGTVKLTRIVRDDPFDVGLSLFVSRYRSRRSTRGRRTYLVRRALIAWRTAPAADAFARTL
jgi:hypothetical protein